VSILKIARDVSENSSPPAGAVAYLPTGWNKCPRFSASSVEQTLPDVQVCYGIACHGANPQPFSALIRLKAKKNGSCGASPFA